MGYPIRHLLHLAAIVAIIYGVMIGSGHAQELASAAGSSPAVDYLRQIKPLLKERCYACHGSLKQRAGLRLDTVNLMRQGGDSGPVIEAGNPSESVLLERVTATEVGVRMPPEHEGELFTAEQVGLLNGWIAGGAVSPVDEQPEADPRDHWAFRPITRPLVPNVQQANATKNPIDAWIAYKREQAGLTPQLEADRLTLLRRLSLDLIGLPPSGDELAAIETDARPDWYERAVERLLADPRHGERWGRHWMDIWRYSDWWGLGDQLRNSQKHIWHWRDWIVESLNSNVPYDEMVRQMLAADELAPADMNKLRASGYLARNYFLFNRNQWMDETVEHVSKGLLGLTMNCAKCHDHKYDPISQTDYYRMRAFFEPYHVRLDLLPGEVDLGRDGLPRAFDGSLDSPTYRFIRGQENSPDKSQVIAPNVPGVLGLPLPEIQPVELPAEAWQPGKRPWVARAYLAAAQKKRATAEANLGPAQEKLNAASKQESELLARLAKQAPDQPGSPVNATAGRQVQEPFTTIDAGRWRLFGGDWTHQPGRLQQRRDGTRAVVRLLPEIPVDFQATLRFTIEGGEPWRSVGISFDATQGDPSGNGGPGTSEQSVYVSAYAGGSKVQAAWQRDGQWNYPAEGLAARPINLNQEYTLQIQVRGTLVNATLNGEPVIAWRSPMERMPGRLQLTLFHAIATLHEFNVVALDPGVSLPEPGSATVDVNTPEGAARAVADAKTALQVAELAVSTAVAEHQSLEALILALEKAGDPERTRVAVLADREFATARARQSVAEAELRLIRAAADKREATEKEVANARDALEQAKKNLDEPGDQLTLPMGAQWTATRFFDSTKDDPSVTFPPQSTGRRSALAAWITDRRNPLTARVAVNHIWARHFGAPLVATVFDLGRKGASTAHPELLDWLASELIESGWDMKHLHRLIVESETYRLSTASVGADASLALDPENRLFWRRTPGRLESQAVRDSILALAGKLDQTPGGPPVPAGEQAQSTRRSLYFFHSNNDRNLFLTTFDEALVKECYRRDQSIVPQQALALSNSQLVLDASPAIAARLTRDLTALGQDAADDSAFIRLAFRLLLGTQPSNAELSASAQALGTWKQKAAEGADVLAFARANLIWVLLNHNDFVTVR